ncbi:MAG: hypothetical protein ABI550_05320 [Ignavibacteriaceae bacterium]
MEISTSKRLLIQILFAAALLLVASNIIFNKFFRVEKPSEFPEVSALEINQKFMNSVLSFGLNNDWIKKDKKTKSDSTFFSYKISIPQDLPITVILSEINSSLKNLNVNIFSKEDKINGKTELTILSKENLKLSASFDYNNEMRRKAGYIGILVSNLNELNDEKLNKVLNFPELFGYIIFPSKSSSEFVKKVSKFRKEYVVILDDEIKELKYKLDEDYSAGRLKSSIRSIIGSFPNASFFLIDNNSDLFSSKIYDFVENEFEKRKIKFIKKNTLFEILSEPLNQIKSSFNNLVRSNEKGWGRVIIVPAENFNLIEDEIISLRKIGYKFISPTQIISNND